MANNEKHPRVSLLLTRPQAGSQAFLDALPRDIAARTVVTISPLIRITPLNKEAPDADAAIFTSANAIDFAGPGMGKTAYCVGLATTKKALKHGWHALMAGQCAEELVSALIETPPHQELTHLGGVHARGNIARRLTDAGIPTQHIALYDQTVHDLNAEAIALLNGEKPVIVPLFSPRTAGQFAKQVPGAAPLHIVALSRAVAAEPGSISHKSLTICENPSLGAMVEEVKKLTLHLTLG